MSEADRERLGADIAALREWVFLQTYGGHPPPPPPSPGPPMSPVERIDLRVHLFGYDEGWPRWFDAECELRHLMLALHQIGGPVWSLRDRYGSARWGMGCGDHVAPSAALNEAIFDWFDDYMEWATGDYMNPRMDPDLPVEQLNEQGQALANRWQAELGPGWVVEYEPFERIQP